MNTELTKELLSRLDALAAKLGVAADQLWAILVRQAQIEAIQDLIVFAFWCALLVTWYLWLGRLTRLGGEKEKEVCELEGMAFAFASASGLAIGIYAWIRMLSIPTRLLNPEYWAFRELSRLLGR